MVGLTREGSCLEEALSLEILVGFARDDVAGVVLHLLLYLGSPTLRLLGGANALPEGQSLLDLRDMCEVCRIGNAETAHAMCMTPLRKVPLERFRSPVSLIATNLAGVVHV